MLIVLWNVLKEKQHCASSTHTHTFPFYCGEKKTIIALAMAATSVHTATPVWVPLADQEYVECPHCCGKNESFECGCPMNGCKVCRTYGKGWGKLAKEFRKQAVTISGQLYPACTFDCIECHDKGTFLRMVEVPIKARYTEGWSDGGINLHPQAEFPCHKCKSNEYNAQKVKIEKVTRKAFAKQNPEMIEKK